jgi:hypothetical protein
MKNIFVTFSRFLRLFVLILDIEMSNCKHIGLDINFHFDYSGIRRIVFK